MLSKHLEDERNDVEVIALDQLFSDDFFVRRLEQAMAFEFI